MESSLDALVIGGGPAGATAALLLARAGWSVVLLERKEFPRRKVCGEYLSATNLPLLDALGVGEGFRQAAGPEVREVGLFAGTTCLRSPLPRGPSGIWGRALGRESLDTFLLQEAGRAGAVVKQPWSATTLVRDEDGFYCRAEGPDPRDRWDLRAGVVIAAHGSWEVGPLPTQPGHSRPRPDDLFGFKAHFDNVDLPAGLMPLVAFPGGYGGMVHCDGGRVSLSCCVRRDRLTRLRQGHNGPAGEAVLDHLRASCLGVRRALAGATRRGPWLAAGPIRPGIRLGPRGGIFPVGNCAGEAHPVVAEGISMAIQGAGLLAGRLLAWKRQGGKRADLGGVADSYAAAWRAAFAPRLYTAAVIAHWAMRPTAVAGLVPLFRRFPGCLTWGARLSGKATRVAGAVIP